MCAGLCVSGPYLPSCEPQSCGLRIADQLIAVTAAHAMPRPSRSSERCQTDSIGTS